MNERVMKKTIRMAGAAVSFWRRASIGGISALLVYFISSDRHLITDVLMLPSYQLNSIVMLLSVLVLVPWIIIRRVRFAAIVRSGWPLTLLILSCIIADWSSPLHTKCSIFLIESIFGVLLAAEYSGAEQQEITAITFGGLVVLSWSVMIFIPHLGEHHGIIPEDIKHAGTWRAIFWHKDQLGGVMGLACIFFLYRLLKGPPARMKILSTLFFLLSAILLWQSHSVTSLVATSLTLCFLCLLFSGMLPTSVRYAFIGLGLCVGLVLPLAVAFFIFYHPASTWIPEWLMKDPTISGRLLVWKQTWLYATQKPWFGHGFSFWDGMEGHRITAWMKFNPYNAHNGLLETFVVAGGVGVCLLLIALTFSAFWVWHSLRTTTGDSPARRDAEWLMLFLVYFVCENIPASRILGTHQLFWIFLLMLSLGRSIRVETEKSGSVA